MRVIFKMLRKHDAQPVDILTLFDPAVLWPVPARYSTSLAYNKLLPRLVTEISVRELSHLFEKVSALVAEHGYQGPAAHAMYAAFGGQALNPLIFTETQPSQLSVKLFSVEYALALSERRGILVVEGNNCFMRLRGTKDIALPVGLYNRKSVTRVPDWLQTILYEPRGYVRYSTFDSLDRCLLWGKKNLVGYDKVDFDMALMSIKGQKNANLTAQFEQLIYTMELPFELKEDDSFDIPFSELMYTEDALDQIKFIWSTGDCPTYDHYKELYNYLVPDYFSRKQFESIFHVGVIGKQSFNYEHVEIIDRRFDAFVAFFKRMMPRNK